MSGKKVIIIGGGIAGLSAGCHLRMNGYKTEIFEMGDKPGRGLPSGLMSGRGDTQMICKKEKKEFITKSLGE